VVSPHVRALVLRLWPSSTHHHHHYDPVLFAWQKRGAKSSLTRWLSHAAACRKRWISSSGGSHGHDWSVKLMKISKRGLAYPRSPPHPGISSSLSNMCYACDQVGVAQHSATSSSATYRTFFFFENTSFPRILGGNIDRLSQPMHLQTTAIAVCLVSRIRSSTVA